MRFGCWACLADFQSTTLVGGKVIILITFLFLVNDLCLASSIEILMDNPHRVSKNFCLHPWDHRSWYQVYQEQFKLKVITGLIFHCISDDNDGWQLALHIRVGYCVITGQDMHAEHLQALCSQLFAAFIIFEYSPIPLLKLNFSY